MSQMSRGGELTRIDYVVVGAGLFGSVFARHAAEAGCQVLLVDRREHIGGNCYTERTEGIDIHRYGPHLFHTNNQKVWQFVNRFAVFNNYRHRGVVRSGDRLFSFPINLQTLHELWGVCTPEEGRQRLAAETQAIDNPRNLEEWALSQIGKELYETFVRGYTTKQWGRAPDQLPASVLRRIPIRLTWDDSYFDDAYQGIPVEGYTRLFENMLRPSVHPARAWRRLSAVSQRTRVHRRSRCLQRHDRSILRLSLWSTRVSFAAFETDLLRGRLIRVPPSSTIATPAFRIHERSNISISPELRAIVP